MVNAVVAIPMALLGFVVIGSQRRRNGMVRRAASYLAAALLVSTGLVFTNHAMYPEPDLQKVCLDVFYHSATSVLFFVTSWLFFYLLFFKKSLEQEEEENEDEV